MAAATTAAAAATAVAASSSDISADEAALVETVRTSLCTMLGGGQDASEADAWLQRLQACDMGWNAAWALLRAGKSIEPEARFFGAKLLQSQLAKRWEHIDNDTRVGLREGLFSALLGAAHDETFIRTRILITLATFATQGIPDYWTGIVGDCIDVFMTHADAFGGKADAIMLLLEFLTVLPQEYATAEMERANRQALGAELRSGFPLLFPLLLELMMQHESPGPPLEAALRCLTAWAAHLPSVISPDDRVHAATVAFEIARSSGGRSDTISDECQLAAVALLHELLTMSATDALPSTVWAATSELLTLAPAFAAAASEGEAGGAGGGGGEDCALALARLVAMVSESHILLLVNPETEEEAETLRALLVLMLEITGLPGQYGVDENVSGVTMHFWSVFTDAVASADHEKHVEYVAAYEDVLLQLVRVWSYKLSLPAEEDSDTEILGRLRAYRQDCAESIGYICSLLAGKCMGTLYSELVDAVETDSLEWRRIEAIVYCLRGAGEFVPEDEREYTPQIMLLFPRIIENIPHPKVMYTTAMALGMYAPWLSTNTELLVQVVPVLLRGLAEASLSVAAASSLKDIAETCDEALSGSLEFALAPCTLAIGNTELPHKARRLTMDAACILLSAAPAEVQLEHMQDVIGPLLARLQTLLEDPSTEAVEARCELSLLDCAFKHLTPDPSAETNPVAPLLSAAWPLLAAMLRWPNGDSHTVELAFSCIHHAVPALDHSFAELLGDFGDAALTSYRAAPHPSIFRTLITIIRCLQTLPTAEAPLVALLNAVYESTFAHFEEPSSAAGGSGGLREQPELSAAFFDFVQMMLRRCSASIWGPTELSGVVMWAATAIRMPERPVVAKTAAALSTILARLSDIPAAQALLAESGPALAEVVLRKACAEAAESMHRAYAEVLAALITARRPPIMTCVVALLEDPEFPNPGVHLKDKQAFLKKLQRDGHRRAKVALALNELSRKAHQASASY